MLEALNGYTRVQNKMLKKNTVRLYTWIFNHMEQKFNTWALASGKILNASLVSETVKNLPTTQETCVQSLGREDPLEKGMVNHSSILAWRIPCTEEPGGLKAMGSQRVGYDWATNTHAHNLKYRPSNLLTVTLGRLNNCSEPASSSFKRSLECIEIKRISEN